MVEQAIEKLEKGLQSGKFDRKAAVMKDAVCAALKDFCRQDGEFSQAVVQGGSFEACMQAVSKAVEGDGISDIDAFTAAVRFYFPGAGIRVEMTIDLCDGVRDGTAPEGKSSGIVLDLMDFL